MIKNVMCICFLAVVVGFVVMNFNIPELYNKADAEFKRLCKITSKEDDAEGAAHIFDDGSDCDVPTYTTLTSWYSRKECCTPKNPNALMANGKPLNDNAFTVASWDYPLGTVLRISTLDGSKTILTEVLSDQEVDFLRNYGNMDLYYRQDVWETGQKVLVFGVSDPAQFKDLISEFRPVWMAHLVRWFDLEIDMDQYEY